MQALLFTIKLPFYFSLILLLLAVLHVLYINLSILLSKAPFYVLVNGLQRVNLQQISLDMLSDEASIF
jgi:hypothetical protein